MKRIRFSTVLVCMALAAFHASCGDDKKKEEAPAPAPADTTAPAPAAASTIVTTPQAMVVIRHKVNDYSKWKPLYDSHDSARLASGLHNYVIGRGIADTNMVLVALKADDIEKAKAFSKDPGLKEAMKKGGVSSTPDISFWTITWQDTVNVGSIPRVLSTFSVKDWNNWEQGFKMNATQRKENGLVDRQYGHQADDDKKVCVVGAVTDSAKAAAHYQSKELKERLQMAGVIGEPNRFWFRVVQRY